MDQRLTTAPPTTEPTRSCRRCGYELRGLATPRCPECGIGFNPDDPGTFSRTPLPRSLRLERRIAKMAIANIGFTIGLALLVSIGNPSNPATVPAFVLCVALFAVSYFILLLQMLAGRRDVRIQVWVRWWTVVIGLVAALMLAGLLQFMADF
jgi:heme A synthase